MNLPEGPPASAPVTGTPNCQRRRRPDKPPVDEDGAQVLLKRDAAAFMGVHPDTIKRWSREGLLPHTWVKARGGRARGFYKSDLLALRAEP